MNIQFSFAKNKHKIIVFCLFLLVSHRGYTNDNVKTKADEQRWTPALTLQQVMTMAVDNDYLLKQHQYHQQAELHLAKAALSYDNPKVSLSILNLPTDSWSLNQEAMTQLKVGVSQSIPRGDSLELKEVVHGLNAQQHEMLEFNQVALLNLRVLNLWFDYHLVVKKIAVVNTNKTTLDQLLNTITSRYQTTVKGSRQQDYLAMKLKRLALIDQNLKLNADLSSLTSQLNGLIGRSGESTIKLSPFRAQGYPELESLVEEHGLYKLVWNEQILSKKVDRHPLVLNQEFQVQRAASNVELAKQQYKPQWNVNASYAFRDSNESHLTRSDFFSVGLTFDVPLFSTNKQDRMVHAEKSVVEANRTKYLLSIQNLTNELTVQWQKLQRLNERHTLYQQSLMLVSSQQHEALMLDYSNDTGELLSVLDARIAENNIKLSAFEVEIERLKTLAKIQYLLAGEKS
ncbi:TolC family protein [Psychrosphaera haliotis]|uniref:TolC family protein n=1 Tax=Psychrosphaera haliotis TaxID=555083 RepID=A0A6N8F4K8_9GAMM|nr:hypothetical protein [Psychrosphaera haliotis]